MRKTILTSIVLATVLSLVLVACGGGTPATTTAPSGDTSGAATSAPVAVDSPVTLRVLVHQNPPMVDFMTSFNESFMAKYPNITVDMSVVNANDLATVTQTRLTANDIDVIDMFGFSNASQSYMKNVDAPNWQQLIDAGLLLDITDQPFVQNYAPEAIADAGTYNGKVYEVNLGRVSYSGIFYNKSIFTDNNVAVPTTWSELVAACETFAAADIPCMTAGGADGWPIFVGAYGLIGSIYPDQAALAEGLWTGAIKWNDATSMVMWDHMKVYAQDMIEDGATGVGADAAAGRFAAGLAAMLPAGTWNASIIETAKPEFEWGYFPFPGSDNTADNQYLFGKYDQGWVIAANTPNKDASLLYLTEFSDPDNYQAFANAVGFIPTQPTATLNTQIGQEVAPFLANFRVGLEQYWIAPKGAGQYANPWATYFVPFGTFEDAKTLADQVQADLQAGLDANK